MDVKRERVASIRRWRRGGTRDTSSPENRHRGQQPVVWLPTPSVYFHITSIDHREREREPVREMEREKMDVLMCLMLTPRPDMSS